MPIMNVQLADAPDREGTNGLKLQGATPSTALSPRLCWATYERDRQEAFKVSIKWRGVPRGDTGGEEYGYTGWSSFIETTLDPETQCNPWQSSTDDLWHWWVSLDSLLGAYVSAINGGAWTYNDRAYDQLNFQVQIETVLQGDPQGYAGYGDLFIGAYPVYTVTDIYVQGDWLVIAYTCPGWTRKDDRWEIKEFTKNNLPILRPGAWGNSAGQVEKLGWVTIPVSSLQRLLEAGDSVYLYIRWNASYRISGADWTEWRGLKALSDHGSANDPTGDVTVNPDGSVSVGVGDSGSGGGSIDSWQVTIEGGGLEFDEVHTTDTSAQAMLNFPPLDVEVTIQIQGSTTTGGTSGVVVETVYIPSNGIALIDPINAAGEREGDQVKAQYNLEWSAKGSRDKNVVKFAGRTRPSAAFGVGGETTVDASWVVPNPQRAPLSLQLQQLADAGLCVVRFPGGERYLVALDGVTTDEAYNHQYTSVSITGQEVS